MRKPDKNLILKSYVLSVFFISPNGVFFNTLQKRTVPLLYDKFYKRRRIKEKKGTIGYHHIGRFNNAYGIVHL